MELLKHELYKIFSRRTVWAAALFFAAVTLFFAFQLSESLLNSYGSMREFYQSVYRGREGPVGAQRANAALKDYEQLSERFKKLPQGGAESRLLQRKMSYDRAAYGAYTQQTAREERIGEYRRAAETARTEHGEHSFEYRNARLRLQMYAGQTPPGVYFTYPWWNVLDFPVVLGFLMLAAMILLGLSPVFSGEYAAGVDALILSSKYGRAKTAGAKIAAGAIYCAAAALFLVLLNLAGQFARLGAAGAGAPFQLIFNYASSPYTFTVGLYFAVETLLFTAAGVFFGLLVMLVSSLCRNALVPFFSCGSLIAVTAGLRAYDVSLPKALTWLVDFSYSELMRGKGLFAEFKTYDIFGFPVPYPALAPAALAAVSAVVLALTVRVFSRRQIQNA